MVGTFGIVNLTRDSFSDGGRFLTPEAALVQARRLWSDGADVLDLGAESTHPDAEDVTVREEIDRLEPVVRELVAARATVSIDTHKPAVMRAMLALGVHWINDVRGFRDPDAMAAAASAPEGVRFVVMFRRSDSARAERPNDDSLALLGQIRSFFAERITAFGKIGIGAHRLVFDPGMGFFLGATAAPSLMALKHLPLLGEFGVPLLVSVSRKSVVGEVTGRSVDRRGPGTIAAELWAARHGAAWIRTHDVAAFRDAWAVEQAIDQAPGLRDALSPALPQV